MKRALPFACIVVAACVFAFYQPERIEVAQIVEAPEGKASDAAEASASEERAVELERKEKATLFGYENFRQSQRGAGKAHPLFGDVLLIEPRSARRAVDDGQTVQVARQAAAMEAFVPRRSAMAAGFSPMANDRVTQGEVTALKEGVTATLTTLERQLIDEVFGETYPLVGRNFGAAWSNNVAGFRYLSALQTAIMAGLNALPNQADYATTNIASAINQRLASAGFAAGSQVVVTVANGPRLAFATSDTFSAANVPLARDLGLPNLRFEFLGSPNGSTAVNANFQFVIGVDGGGFYFDASSATFQFNTTTTVSQSINAAARFNFLPYTANDPNVDRTSVPLNFTIFLRDPNNSGDVRMNELGGDLLNASVTGNTRTSLRIVSTLPSTAMLPQLRSDLKVRWNFTDAVVNPNDDNATFGARPELTLDNNSVNLESFFNSFAGRTFNQIDRAMEPFKGVIAVLTREIPLLSDLGSDAVTILDVLGVEPEVVDAIEDIGAIADLASLASSFTGNGSVFVDLGAYGMSGDLRTSPLEDLSGASLRPPATAGRDADLVRFTTDAGAISGFQFQILTDETVVARLLLGRPATLFTYDSGENGFREDFRQFFPVLGPVGITLGGAVGLTNRFGFGYDTFGLEKFIAGGANDPGLLTDGFFAMATDEQGRPLTGVTLSAGITAGLGVNLGFASAGVEGDLTATIGIYLNDFIADDQGRIRGSTFANAAFDDLFYAAGSLSAGLRAYIDVGIPPFAVSYEIESPRAVLLTYDSRDPDVPVLAEMTAGVLILNVGDRAERRIHGDNEDRAEEYTIESGAGGLVVKAFNHENSFGTPVSILGQAKNRGDILAMNSTLNIPVFFTGGDSIDILTGGAANDTLEGEAGPDKLRGNGGNDVLRGGADNDELNGGDGNDELDGGDGMDLASWNGSLLPVTIDLRTGSFGGAAAGDTLISIERYAGTGNNDEMDGSEGNDSLLRGLAGNDNIRGHGGDDLLEGGTGEDNVQGGSGNDMIVGGAGADILDGGPGNDVLSYLGALSPVTVSLLTATGTRGDANGDTLSNFEILMGSGLPHEEGSILESGDVLEGSDNGETIFGMDGADEIRGMGGNDVIHGNHPDAEGSLRLGFDADKIHGGAGDDQIFGQGDNDELDGGEGVDMLKGGPGDDHLITFDALSVDALDGEAGTNRLSADYTDKITPFIFTVGTNNSHTFPDGDQYQNMHTLGQVNSGAGNDVIRLAASVEHAFWNKQIDAGPGDDLIIADYRGFFPGILIRTSDNLAGGEGDDTISFEQSIGGVTINLGSNGTGGYADEVTISGFENVIGSNFPDSLNGTTNNNILNPLHGGPNVGGADIVSGGAGDDILRVDYSNHPLVNQQGISMTPNATSGYEAIVLGPNWDVGGNLGLCAYIGIERFEITGGAMSDRIYGEGVGTAGDHNYNDRLIGLGGNDLLDSRMGDDFLDGGEGDDNLRAGAGSDTVMGGPGNDNILFEPSTGYGNDFVDAGPGDDSVRNANFPGGDSTSGNASTVFRFDGGDGFDTLQVDLGYVTTALRIDDVSGPVEFALPNNGYIRGFEHFLALTTGTGNDYVVLGGRRNNTVSLRAGNDTINPGVGIDVINGGLAGDDLLIMDYSVGDDADVGPAIYNVNNSRHERRLLSSNTVIDSLTASQFERFHFTGSSKNDSLRSFDGADVLRGMEGDDTLDGGNGADLLDGGPGADRLIGGNQNDTFIVDNAGDIVTELASNGSDTVWAQIDYTLPANVEHLQLLGGAVTGVGNSASNNITGNTRSNVLRGEGGNDVLDAAGIGVKVDRLNGGPGADTFVLGEGAIRYYDDQSAANPGHNAYAIIEDFTPSQSDRLRVAGARAEYFLGASPIAEVAGTAVYHDSNGNGSLDSATDELIAILISTESLTVGNTIDSAAQTVDPASIGLNDPIRGAISSIDPQRFAVEFEMSEALPAGVTLEIQASPDMGETYPWQTIATKIGAGNWAGSATVTVGPPANGKVTVSIADVQPMLELPKKFFRARLRQ